MSWLSTSARHPVFNPRNFFQAVSYISIINFLRLRLRSLGLCLRKNVAHASVDFVLGFHSHTWLSSYRIMQISRIEISQELRLMRMTLPGHDSTPRYVLRHRPSFLFLRSSAVGLLEAAGVKILGRYASLARRLRTSTETPCCTFGQTAFPGHGGTSVSRAQVRPRPSSIEGRPTDIRLQGSSK